MLDLLVLLLTLAAAEEAAKPGRWTKYNGYEYKVFSDDLMSFLQAEFKCNKRGGRLASIHSQQENDFVLSLIPHTTEPELFIRHAWIGLYRVESEWAWSDGSKAKKYSLWVNNKPNYLQFTKYCAFMYINGSKHAGKWDEQKCHEQLFSYVCKRRIGNNRHNYCL